MDKSNKKAILVISLVPEANSISNREIKKQIKEESSIPFLVKIESIQIEEKTESPYAMLRGHGISQKTTQNVLEFYGF